MMKLFRNHCARNVGGECIVVYNDRVAHQACVVMSFVDYLALKAKATAPIKKEATNV